MKIPLLSVCLITYNHEKFIRQALDGIIMQKVNFSWELIIADDFSTDKTRDIILEYKEKHHDFIKLIFQKKNVGPAINFIELISDPISKYIAYLEGDDYWTDSLKLQKQVDFLEANPDYALCFHHVSILKTDGNIVDDFITKVPADYEKIETLARLGNYINSPSVVFRNVIKEFPFEFELSPMGDFFLYMMLAEQGKLKYLEEKMAVYRQDVGIWSQKNNYFKDFNTAYSQALLYSYFKNKSLLQSIFTDRIKIFLKNGENQITAENLLQLSLNNDLQKEILDFLIIRNATLKKEVLFYKSTKNLVFELSQRLKQKLWKL